jgi:hypothetical protein
VILIYNAPPLNISSGPHSYLGWIVLALVGFQIWGGILRGSKGGPTDKSLRGDHFDMSFKRLLFEVVHKLFGYGALVLSVAAILSGMWQANAPVWMWFVLPVWWSVLIVLFMACQRRGMAVDTYQAIWGPDPTFPGNVRKASRTGNRQSRHEAGE